MLPVHGEPPREPELSDVRDAPDVPYVIGAALEVLSRPALWIGFAIAFVALVGLLLALASGGGAEGARFDYDLF
jgi:hypothetical protein